MKLHESKYEFLAILDLIHERTNIRLDILEKDYYITMMLKELAGKQADLPVYFKGGTAVYKAQRSLRRFSEDLDLTVCIDGCTNSQAKKRLELSAKKYRCLPRTQNKELEDDRKGSITAVYDYMPAVTVDADDPLQRFGYVKVEATSFTVSEPFMPLQVEPAIYTYANEEQRNILKDRFDIAPFMVNTICLSRIFADKIFAAEFYYDRGMYFDVAKHVYDTSVMLDLPEIQTLVHNEQEFTRMLGYKRLEETRRVGSDLAGRRYRDFRILKGFMDNDRFLADYARMQNNYVFAEADMLPVEYTEAQWKKIREILFSLE